MDSSPPSTIVSASPVRAPGPAPCQLLLPSDTRVGPEPVLPAIAGRRIYPASLLRRAQNDGVATVAAACGGTQTGAAPAASNGANGRLSQTPIEPQPGGAQAVPLSIERPGHRAPQPGLEHRH